MKVDVLGVLFDKVTMPQAVDRAQALMKERRGAYVCTPNPEIVWACHRQPAMMEAVRGADLVLADGVGVLLGAKILQRPLPERVTGYDFCCSLLASMEGSVFLLGGKPGVAERAAGTIGQQYPRVRVCGWSNGFYSDEDALVARIRAAAPDFLVVCLGTPRQELFMQRHAGLPEIGLMAGLGGTLDVLVGDIPRAPDFFIRHKIEWLYRLWREPRRIKRQIRLPLYLLAVVRQRIRHEQGKTDRSRRH